MNASLPAEPPLLEVADLHTHFTSFGGARVIKAVDGISFTLNAGETLGLIGESGCGKTTTCLSIVGLLPAGARIAGPAVLEQPDATTVIEPGLIGRIDRLGNLIVETA